MWNESNNLIEHSNRERLLSLRPIPQLPRLSTRDLALIPIIPDLGGLDSDLLVDPSKFGVAVLPIYARPIPPYRSALAGALDRVLVRPAIARRLADASGLLEPDGLGLVVLDGWRPAVVQQALWDRFVAEARKSLPGAPDAQVEAEAALRCSDPRNRSDDVMRPAYLHQTGAAVDVWPVSLATGQMAFMGAIFDETGPMADIDAFENRVSSASDRVARSNRRALFWAMVEAGFAPLASEFWHFGFGDQLAARFYGRRAVFPAISERSLQCATK